MKVRKLTHRNLAEAFRLVEIEFPDRGLVLVTGVNGSGKSTGTLEACSTALYGKPVVGDPVWRPDTAAMASATLGNGVVATRRMTKGGAARFEVSGEGLDEAVTGTKAKAQLAKFIPSHEVWVNACVLSSETLGSFSRAADKARTHMVEELLGLSYLDIAHKAAEKAFKTAKADEHRLNLARVKAEGDANTAAAALAGLSSQVTAPTEESIQAMRDQVIQLQAEKAALDLEVGEVTESIVAANAKAKAVSDAISAAQTKFDQLSDQKGQMLGGVCPTCGQDIAGQDTGAIDAAMAHAQLNIAAAEPANYAESLGFLAELQTKYHAICTARDGNLRTTTQVTAQGQVAAKQRLDEDSLTGRVSQATTVKNDAKLVAVNCDQSHIFAQSEMEVLDQARIALGVKGVRTYLLPEALAAITTVANSWLGVISGPGLSLRVFEEKDKIELRIYGRGRGTYGSLSLGYKRRVDLALLLAFSEVARQSLSMDSVTLFCDEPFLGFDPEGIEVVSGILNQLAEDHCVVVITNQTTVAKSVRPDAHYHVSNNEYRRVS